jgi:hypothetical protein
MPTFIVGMWTKIVKLWNCNDAKWIYISLLIIAIDLLIEKMHAFIEMTLAAIVLYLLQSMENHIELTYVSHHAPWMGHLVSHV